MGLFASSISQRGCRWRHLSAGITAALCFIMILACARTHSSAQDLDKLRLGRAVADSPLVWDNLTNSEQYLSGVCPAFSRRHRLSFVRLEPGECVEFLVPEFAQIRVQSCGQAQLSADDVWVWTSDGSGMYRRILSAIGADGKSLISAPHQAELSIAKIERPDFCRGTITVAVFTSRRAVNSRLDYYQCTLDNSAPLTDIVDGRGGPVRTYTRLAAGSVESFTVHPRTRLRLEARLEYGLEGRTTTDLLDSTGS